MQIYNYYKFQLILEIVKLWIDFKILWYLGY
jgi:hypothetical protein